MHLSKLGPSREDKTQGKLTYFSGKPKSNSAPMDTNLVNANSYPFPWELILSQASPRKQNILSLGALNLPFLSLGNKEYFYSHKDGMLVHPRVNPSIDPN